jgi:hypothetical protein
VIQSVAETILSKARLFKNYLDEILYLGRLGRMTSAYKLNEATTLPFNIQWESEYLTSPVLEFSILERTGH